MKRSFGKFIKVWSKPGWAKHLKPYGKRKANKKSRKYKIKIEDK